MEWSWTGFCTCSHRCISGTFWQSEHHLPSYTQSMVNPATCTDSLGNQPLISGLNVLLKKKIESYLVVKSSDKYIQSKQFHTNNKWQIIDSVPMIRSTSWYWECRSSINSSWQLKYSISSGEAAFNLGRGEKSNRKSEIACLSFIINQHFWKWLEKLMTGLNPCRDYEIVGEDNTAKDRLGYIICLNTNTTVHWKKLGILFFLCSGDWVASVTWGHR